MNIPDKPAIAKKPNEIKGVYRNRLEVLALERRQLAFWKFVFVGALSLVLAALTIFPAVASWFTYDAAKRSLEQQITDNGKLLSFQSDAQIARIEGSVAVLRREIDQLEKDRESLDRLQKEINASGQAVIKEIGNLKQEQKQVRELIDVANASAVLATDNERDLRDRLFYTAIMNDNAMVYHTRYATASTLMVTIYGTRKENDNLSVILSEIVASLSEALANCIALRESGRAIIDSKRNMVLPVVTPGEESVPRIIDKLVLVKKWSMQNLEIAEVVKTQSRIKIPYYFCAYPKDDSSAGRLSSRTEALSELLQRAKSHVSPDKLSVVEELVDWYK